MKPKKLEGKLKWKVEAFGDSDHAGNTDTHLSMTGWIIYLMDAPVLWKSRAQQNVTLSLMEAEYVAVSELCMEILFVRQILEFLGEKVNYPIIINVDNQGAVFLAHNDGASIRTQHINVRYRFVREYMENRVVKIVFVRLEENNSDVFTKNTMMEIFHRHTGKFMVEVDDEVNEEEEG